MGAGRTKTLVYVPPLLIPDAYLFPRGTTWRFLGTISYSMILMCGRPGATGTDLVPKLGREKLYSCVHVFMPGSLPP